MKKILSALLAFTVLISLFASCGNQPSEKKEDDTMHTLYFKDSSKSDKVTATFFNSDSGKSKDVKMKKVSEDKSFRTYSCKGDCSVYNMAYITCGEEKTTDFAFNKCTSGWYKTEDEFMPYTQGEKIKYTPKFDDLSLKGCGYEKKIHIWKPDDYDASSDEKYSTIYVLDGQNVAYGGTEGSNIKHSPGFIEQVRAMTSVTGKKAIVVAIENVFARDYELVPEIGKSFDEKMGGEVEYESMNGTQFAEFIAKTLAPYVRSRYSVYSDALHTSVIGCSLGGLEAFYIAMEYPDVFGTGGSLSPSFWEYDAATWHKYLKQKTFDSNSPFIYIYTGSPKFDVPKVKGMYNRLKKLGYPDDKLVLHYNEEGSHSGVRWCSVFSEFLEAMMFRSVDGLS